MARRQRSRRATIVRDLVLGLAVVTVGAGGLWVAWQMRPAEFRNQPASAPPTTVETQAELMADRPDWIAWANGHPLCMEMGRTEEIARQHVGQAVQLGMRAECVWTPADSTGALGRTAEGWYPDPLKQMGEGTLRHWDGATWGDLWAPSWGPPPGPVIPHG